MVTKTANRLNYQNNQVTKLAKLKRKEHRQVKKNARQKLNFLILNHKKSLDAQNSFSSNLETRLNLLDSKKSKRNLKSLS